jgi:hypothetical protein
VRDGYIVDFETELEEKFFLIFGHVLDQSFLSL